MVWTNNHENFIQILKSFLKCFDINKIEFNFVANNL